VETISIFKLGFSFHQMGKDQKKKFEFLKVYDFFQFIGLWYDLHPSFGFDQIVYDC
jgi:hypothetical protein